jgi:Cu+-exporting ATPase
LLRKQVTKIFNIISFLILYWIESEYRDYVLRLAAIAESGSEHPLANAVMSAAKERNIKFSSNECSNFSHHVGGVCCVLNDKLSPGKIIVGNRGHMEVNNITLGPLVDSAMWDLEVQGKTAVCVAFNDTIFGVLGIADAVKEEAVTTIAGLKSMGIDVWMVTGDNRTTAEAIADELNISNDRVIAGVLPADKVRKVEELQGLGRVVAMIGDGINDAPALARADLGVAIGAGTHIAIDAAEMVLIRNNLHDVIVALDLARVVFNRIRLNLMWAMIYNVLAIPVAAGIWFPWTHALLPPQYAGFCMAVSSISVVLSSICLRLYKRPAIVIKKSGIEQSGEEQTIISKARR